MKSKDYEPIAVFVGGDNQMTIARVIDRVPSCKGKSSITIKLRPPFGDTIILPTVPDSSIIPMNLNDGKKVIPNGALLIKRDAFSNLPFILSEKYEQMEQEINNWKIKCEVLDSYMNDLSELSRTANSESKLEAYEDKQLDRHQHRKGKTALFSHEIEQIKRGRF